jgi:hypothetical protein
MRLNDVYTYLVVEADEKKKKNDDTTVTVTVSGRGTEEEQEPKGADIEANGPKEDDAEPKDQQARLDAAKSEGIKTMRRRVTEVRNKLDKALDEADDVYTMIDTMDESMGMGSFSKKLMSAISTGRQAVDKLTEIAKKSR